MSAYHDPELDDILPEDDLRRIASLLMSARGAEPPLDDAFRTGLRRQLMNEAWAMSEGRASWSRRFFGPPVLAWAGATAGLLLIASLVMWNALQQPLGSSTEFVASPIDGNRNVPLQQPILVAFNQPMDHGSTERAVQITPATTVTFAWESNTLAVQPTGGNLAPNTQYHVTIGPGAMTASGKPLLSSPKTITFVTQPPTTPSASPTPRPSPSSSLGDRPLASLGGAPTLAAAWSADSSSVYFVDGAGALKTVPAAGGTVGVIASDGASSPVISPAGDRLAYIRAGKIEVLTFASGKTDELAVTPAPMLLAWSKDQLVWAAAGAIYGEEADGSAVQIATLPAGGTVSVVSFAPDGVHAAYTQDSKLFLLDLGTGKSVQLGQAGASFAGWSPVAPELLYSTADGIVVADFQGQAQSTLPPGDASWSSQDAVILGSDTDVYEVRPDGSNLSKLANGTYHAPVWAPNGASFVFVRGGSIWSAMAPPLPPEPSVLDEATSVVNSFMQARLKKDATLASTFLDAAGKQAYSQDGLSLIVNGDPSFSRYYVLTQEIAGTDPDAARFVVRLVLSHANSDVSDFEESLTLVRDATTKQLLIDGASAGPSRNLGKGPEVVAVDVATDTIKLTFDSDLDPGTVTDGLTVVDSNGNPVAATIAYGNRVVTITGLSLKPGAQYKLVVLTSVRDVLGQNIASEYDLTIVGPPAKRHGNQKGSDTTPATAIPAVTPAA